MRCLLLFLLLLFSCGAQQKPTINNETVQDIAHCPGDGICSLSVLSNQSFTIEKDGIGALYPKISEGNTIVLKFEYHRNEIPDTVDGNYSEVVYLELDPNNLEIDLENIDLKNAKALFSRLCFCRGQTGNYQIKQGKLSLKKITKRQYRLKMNFKINEVPQIISTIDEVFTIK